MIPLELNFSLRYPGEERLILLLLSGRGLFCTEFARIYCCYLDWTFLKPNLRIFQWKILNYAISHTKQQNNWYISQDFQTSRKFSTEMTAPSIHSLAHQSHSRRCAVNGKWECFFSQDSNPLQPCYHLWWEPRGLLALLSNFLLRCEINILRI